MSRIRTIKPEFFRHEGLQELENDCPGEHVMLVFAALWGHCDKNGVFEWKPRSLKLDILPFVTFDMETTLERLEDAGFIHRFVHGDKEYGVIESFGTHQRIGGKEATDLSRFPDPPNRGSNGEAMGKQRGSNGEKLELQEGKGRELGKGKGKGREDGAAAPAGLDLATWERWTAYRSEIRKPLKPASIPAAQRSLAAFGSEQAAVVEQSIANGWQGLFPIKRNLGGPAPPAPKKPPPTEEELAQARLAAIEKNRREMERLNRPQLEAAEKRDVAGLIRAAAAKVNVTGGR